MKKPLLPVFVFVHCWACRLPVTPSGRRSLLMQPAGGDPAKLCDLTQLQRAGVDVAREAFAEAILAKKPAAVRR